MPSYPPEAKQRGATVSAASVGAATVMALALFVATPMEAEAGTRDFLSVDGSAILVASADGVAAGDVKNAPPPITTTSTTQALKVAESLSKLDARMYGAFWCSHCFEQKQTLGMEAVQTYVPYVECDKEGYQNQRALCKSKDVPGYPTWEIGGKLFPGERSLGELEEIVKDMQQSGK